MEEFSDAPDDILWWVATDWVVKKNVISIYWLEMNGIWSIQTRIPSFGMSRKTNSLNKRTGIFVQHRSLVHAAWRNVGGCCCGVLLSLELWTHQGKSCCPALRSGPVYEHDQGIDRWWCCWLCRDSFVLKMSSCAVVWLMSACPPPPIDWPKIFYPVWDVSGNTIVLNHEQLLEWGMLLIFSAGFRCV